MGDSLEETLLEVLRPSIRQMVRRELSKAEYEWRWKTAEQAAEVLGISVGAVRQRFQRGTLPGVKRGKHIYVDFRALSEQLDGHPPPPLP